MKDEMPPRPLDIRTWAAMLLFIGGAFFLGTRLTPDAAAPVAERHDGQAATTVAATSARQSARPAQPPATAASAPATASTGAPPTPDATPVPKPQPAQQSAHTFVPPPDGDIKPDDFGAMIRRGEALFNETKANAPEFVGNDLNCRNCHLDGGRMANASPLWAAYGAYPAYRSKDKQVSTFQNRLQGCFQYSMNGKAPPHGDAVLVALETYAYFLARGAPVGVDMAGRGYPKLTKPANLDRARGQQIYAENCVVCHGAIGEGRRSHNGEILFPPLWGERSYNWGAGMSNIDNAAAFIKANMPYSRGNTLSNRDAWDVAAFIDTQERPQDPRFTGDVAETRKQFHDTPMNFYGQTVDGRLLGKDSPPYGTVPVQ